jgi:methyltransferase family protein
LIEGSDADSFAYSLSNFAEILFPCLEAVEPRSIVEVGAFRGATTRDLLAWGEQRDCKVTAVEPTPPDELLELERERPELNLVRETSLEALPRIEPAEVIILDGDHNYYTTSRELQLIHDRAPGARMPLVLLHDVGWPLARRDAYEAPEQIPEEHRQPMAHAVGLAPGEPGVVPGGLFYSNVAAREGGPRNGVMTAIEDFMSERAGLRLAVVHAFFGLGVIWHEDAAWAGEVEALLEPWDRNPILKRLEENRIWHLIARLDLDHELDEERERGRQGEQRSGSQANRMATRFSALRRRLSPRA